MAKCIDSELCVKACKNIDVSKDLEKPEGKCIAQLLDEQKEDEKNITERG